MSRYRVRERSYYGGGTKTLLSRGYVSRIPGGLSSKDWMTDTPSASDPYPDKPAYRKDWWVKPGRFNGVDRRYGRSQWKHENVPWDASYHGPATPKIRSWRELKNEALANLQPKPIVDIPLFVAEMREFPKMIRDAGRLLSGKGGVGLGDTYLSYTFGWAPLLSDLQTLMSLAEHFFREVDRVKKIQRTKRSEGRLMSIEKNVPASGLYSYSSGYTRVSYTADVQVQQKAWYVAKFKTYIVPPDIDAGGFNSLRYAMGMKGHSPVSLWNAIPWTWLIDYFSTIGSFIEANKNVASYDMENLCIMQRSTVERTSRIISAKYYEGSLSPGTSKTTYWERRIYNDPRPGVYFEPILSSGQMANIGAILAAGRARYHA